MLINAVGLLLSFLDLFNAYSIICAENTVFSIQFYKLNSYLSHSLAFKVDLQVSMPKQLRMTAFRNKINIANLWP